VFAKSCPGTLADIPKKSCFLFGTYYLSNNFSSTSWLPLSR